MVQNRMPLTELISLKNVYTKKNINNSDNKIMNDKIYFHIYS